eukprot:COSAG04_NODE_1465_length_6606_cov_59.955279_3_plen_173_part_00
MAMAAAEFEKEDLDSIEKLHRDAADNLQKGQELTQKGDMELAMQFFKLHRQKLNDAARLHGALQPASNAAADDDRMKQLSEQLKLCSFGNSAAAPSSGAPRGRGRGRARGKTSPVSLCLSFYMIVALRRLSASNQALVLVPVQAPAITKPAQAAQKVVTRRAAKAALEEGEQ